MIVEVPGSAGACLDPTACSRVRHLWNGASFNLVIGQLRRIINRGLGRPRRFRALSGIAFVGKRLVAASINHGIVNVAVKFDSLVP